MKPEAAVIVGQTHLAERREPQTYCGQWRGFGTLSVTLVREYTTCGDCIAALAKQIKEKPHG